MPAPSSQREHDDHVDELQTPDSLIGERQVPTLSGQLEHYELTHPGGEEDEELDPAIAQGVYLLAAGVMGLVLATALASAVAGLVWIL